MIDTFEEHKKVLEEFKAKIKTLPLLERKNAVMLFDIYQQIIKIEEEQEKAREEAFKTYSKEIETFTSEMDLIVEGKRKVTEEELNFWKTCAEPEFVAKEEDNDSAPFLGFWKNYILNSDIYHGDQDGPMLAHLKKMEINDADADEKGQKITSLTCHFTPNEFFENEVLTTKLIYVNDELVKSEGTEIKWKNNPTVKKTTKTQKNKRTGQTRSIVKEQQLRSFFEIFNDFVLDQEDDKEGQDGEEPPMDLYTAEESINEISESLPYALEYFLDIKNDDDEDAIDEEDEEDDDEDEEGDRHPHKKKASKNASRKDSEHQKAPKAGNQPGGKQQECKQQ
jgi:hypothetical protein